MAEKWNGEEKSPRVPTPLHWELLFDEDEDDIFYDARDSWHEEQPKTYEDVHIAPLEQVDLKHDDNEAGGAQFQIISGDNCEPWLWLNTAGNDDGRGRDWTAELHWDKKL